MIQVDKHSKIQLLPENIIDQIKAGEVIERPATLLKELLENSLDAGATRIRITIENNGIDLISVSDNGQGISFDELPMAFYRHATSKISRFEDLYGLYSYGFRGEALASMASVSKITCSTTREGEVSVLKIEGGEITSHQKSEYHGKNSGTDIYVRDLFYNTPVRLKFIGSKTSEKNQLKKIIASFILTRPEVEFSVKFDEGLSKNYPALENQQDRINQLLFPKNKQDFYHANQSYDDIEVSIYLSHSASKGNAGKSHFIFVNDRYIQDIKMHKIICHTASSLWNFNLIGHYIVFIKVPPHFLDVNVHPNKINVKFHTPAKVHAVLSQAIKNIEVPIKHDSSEPQEQSIATQLIGHNSFDYHGSRFSHLSEGEMQKTEFIILSENYIYYNHYLVDLEKFIHFLVDSIPADTRITPLLVAIPIRNLNSIDNQQIEFLTKMGFELSVMDSTTLLLKSIPSAIDFLDPEKLIRIYLDKDERIHGKSLIQNNVQLESILNSQDFTALENLKVAKLLNNHLLEKIFYEQ